MGNNNRRICPVCNGEKEFVIDTICHTCRDKGYCINGCGQKGVSWCCRCKECEKKHSKGMKILKQWLKDNGYVHKDTKI